MSLFSGRVDVVTVGGLGISVANGPVDAVVTGYQQHLAVTLAAVQGDKGTAPANRFVLDHRPATQSEMLVVLPDTLGFSATNVVPLPEGGIHLTDHSRIKCIEAPQGEVVLVVLPVA